jgi:hypothetical protein
MQSTILVKNPERKRPLAKSRHRQEIKLILSKKNGRGWTGFIWLRPGKKGGFCGHSNEPSGSIQWEEFLD